MLLTGFRLSPGRGRCNSTMGSWNRSGARWPWLRASAELGGLCCSLHRTSLSRATRLGIEHSLGAAEAVVMAARVPRVAPGVFLDVPRALRPYVPFVAGGVVAAAAVPAPALRARPALGRFHLALLGLDAGWIWRWARGWLWTVQIRAIDVVVLPTGVASSHLGVAASLRARVPRYELGRFAAPTYPTG